MQTEFFPYLFFFGLEILLLGTLSGSEDEMTPPESEEKHPPRGDQPHLRFEITSDDGFIVEADSIEGNMWPSVTF